MLQVTRLRACQFSWSCVTTIGTARRLLSTAMDAPRFRFSAGSDDAALTAAAVPLLADGGKGGRWTLVKDGTAIERSFRFKTFAKTWDFMTAVSLQCKIKNHHPEWSNVYNTSFIRWTTHKPRGLSDKDVAMAALCDSIAKDFGEQRDNAPPADEAKASAPSQSGNVGKDLVDQVVASTGECGPCATWEPPAATSAKASEGGLE